MTRQAKAYIALVYVCIAWGTTYLAIRVGVEHYPTAFLFAGVRQAISGVILMTAALYVNRKYDLSTKNVLRQMLIGFLMLTVGNGCVTWGEKYIPSGIAALICSMMPLFAVLFNLMSSKRDKLNLLIGAGLLMGVGGVALIFRQSVSDLGNSKYLGGMLATLLATCSWAFGSIINKKNVNPVNAFLNSGMQLFFGGIFMLLISPVVDDYSNFVLWSTPGVLSLVYLIVFGSVLAYAAYMYALAELPVGIATIYAYINPLIAVVAGAVFLDEQLNVYTGLAFVTIVASVYLVNRGYRKQQRDQKIIIDKQAAAFPESAPVES